MNKSVNNLKLKCDTNYNAKSFLFQTSDGKEILDYIRRLENLNATYEILFDKVQLAVNCNDCPFVQGCVYQKGKVEDCQLKMLNRTCNLGVTV